MKFAYKLPFYNIAGRPLRSFGLISLAFFLAFAVFAGSLLISGFNSGLRSLGSRLGADIIVVPYYDANAHTIEGILLQGNPGYFYMNKKVLEQVSELPGVQKASPQFYLASIEADCCSSKAQLIGFDPKSDFVIRPWLQTEFPEELRDDEVIVGSGIFVNFDNTVTFYERKLTVVGKLNRTGTAIDDNVYANSETIKKLLAASIEQGRINNIADPEMVISSVMVKVADGHEVQEIADQIVSKLNAEITAVKVIKTDDMVSDLSRTIGTFSSIIAALAGAVWFLSVAIMIISQMMITGERKLEFAVLRISGAAKNTVSKIVFAEAFVVSLIGSVPGVFLGGVLVFSFSHLLQKSLNMPFVIGSPAQIAIYAFAAIFLCVISGAIAAAVSARKIVKSDVAALLR